MERWQVKVGAGPLERLAASEFNPYQERNCGRGYKNGWLTTEKANLSVAVLIYRSLSGAPDRPLLYAEAVRIRRSSSAAFEATESSVSGMVLLLWMGHTGAFTRVVGV